MHRTLIRTFCSLFAAACLVGCGSSGAARYRPPTERAADRTANRPAERPSPTREASPPVPARSAPSRPSPAAALPPAVDLPTGAVSADRFARLLAAADSRLGRGDTVDFLRGEQLRTRDILPRTASPGSTRPAAAAVPLPAVTDAPPSGGPPVRDPLPTATGGGAATGLYLQLAAARDEASARAVESAARSEVPDVPSVVLAVGGLFKVQLGPFADRAAADAVRAKLVARYPGAFIVVR